MDVTITLFGIVAILGSLIFSKQLGGVLLVLGILRFTVNGNRGHYLMLAGLLILIVGVDLTANNMDPPETEKTLEDLGYSKVPAEIINSEVFNSELWTFLPSLMPIVG